MAKYGDLLVGLLALVYTILAVVLKEMHTVDLGAYLAQPALSGPFAMAALGRGWRVLKAAGKAKANEEPEEASESAEGKPQDEVE